MLSRLFKFNGGVKPETHKAPSVEQPIGQAPLPERCYVPLHQSLGGAASPVVGVGQSVRKGQLLGNADGWVSAAVHAPTSGTVVAIEEHVAAHPSGLPTLTAVIAPDGQDEWIDRQPVDYRRLPPERVRELLRDAGVVGLGGAVFPSHAKLSAAKNIPVEHLVINGAECEPFMTCDDMLMRERAEEIVRGSAIFRELLGARQVLIGIEDNKPQAVAAMQAAVSHLGEDHEVVAVPTRYPAGGAKQLIRVLTGKEVPASRRSTDLAVQCFNVATAYTAYRALAYGEPVISRIVTVTGNVEQARNWDVRLGTPMRDVLALARPKTGTHQYLMGGPMMGFEIPDLAAPVVKATNCLIAGSPSLFPPPPPEMPCIRCGACADACPHELQPFELYWFARARNFGKTQEYFIFDCIECGCCSYVCPSHIPLVQYFRFAKSEIWAREREKQAADAAKARFEWRNAREEREAAEKAERLAKAAASRPARPVAEKTESATPSAPPSSQSFHSSPSTIVAADGVVQTASSAAADVAPQPVAADAAATKQATIAAAMARARAQREAAQPKNTVALTDDQQREIAAIDARRAAPAKPTDSTPGAGSG
ncbi:MAG: electron transport complex subunit RsxC [Candidatus Accumulibacter sp.]|nr:electron transport complex subunit RsxC [Accumulibacter sp.]